MPVRVGQVQAAAHDRRELDGLAALVDDAQAANDERAPPVDRQEQVRHDARRRILKDDLHAVRLRLVLDVGRGQPLKLRLARQQSMIPVDKVEDGAAVGVSDGQARAAQVAATGRGHLEADRVEHLVLVRDEGLADEVPVIATGGQRRTEVEVSQGARLQHRHDVADGAVVQVQLARLGAPLDGHGQRSPCAMRCDRLRCGRLGRSRARALMVRRPRARFVHTLVQSRLRYVPFGNGREHKGYRTVKKTIVAGALVLSLFVVGCNNESDARSAPAVPRLRRRMRSSPSRPRSRMPSESTAAEVEGAAESMVAEAVESPAA